MICADRQPDTQTHYGAGDSSSGWHRCQRIEEVIQASNMSQPI